MAASPQRPSFQAGDDTSPFSMLKGECSDEQQGFILRTRSLDEANQLHAQNYTGLETSTPDDLPHSASAALHSSFDAALLTHGQESSFFAEDEAKFETSRTPSWDEDYG